MGLTGPQGPTGPVVQTNVSEYTIPITDITLGLYDGENFNNLTISLTNTSLLYLTNISGISYYSGVIYIVIASGVTAGNGLYQLTITPNTTFPTLINPQYMGTVTTSLYGGSIYDEVPSFVGLQSTYSIDNNGQIIINFSVIPTTTTIIPNGNVIEVHWSTYGF